MIVRTDEMLACPASVSKMSKSEYERRMPELQGMMASVASRLSESDRAMIVVFEGLDASGKSGCIKRLTEKLDLRQYKVIPISKPTDEEYKYNYLRRFWLELPKYGNIVFFDRSWYGRVLVERIEGFATHEEWSRAYREIDSFEKLLTDDGTIIVKLWLDVSPEEQLKRFKKRLSDPAKQHKITDEDWRNRSQRELYNAARDDMIRLTDTAYAPWFVIPADDKKYARVRAAEEIIAWADIQS